MSCTDREKWQSWLRATTRLVIAVTTLCFAGIGDAFANYIGPAYLQIPGIAGGVKQKPYLDWIRTEAHYWNKRPAFHEIRGISGDYNVLQFSGPHAPQKGPEMLAVSVDKNSPGLKPLMELCQSGTVIPEVTFAESSEMERHSQERGPRPADVPEYYEFSLRNVHLTCQVVADAPEQAFGVHFDEIQWKNFPPQPYKAKPITGEPAKLPPGPKSGSSKVFVLTSLVPVADSNRDDQCPKMNTKPTQDDYFALMSPDRAAQQRAALAKQGGANPVNLPYRGPEEMDVCEVPGTVRDPGLIEPQAQVVDGFDLDGNDGSGEPPSGIRKHTNYTSPDGRQGIDNQLFKVQGCVEGWRRNGFLTTIGNELRRAGGTTMLIEISGMHDERNDKDIVVTFMYSSDPMKRDGTSKVVLPDFTYRVSGEPQFTQSYARFKGKIVNGVITTDPLPQFEMRSGNANVNIWYKARLRMEVQSDGTLRGTLGGYRDWRKFVAYAFFQKSAYENTIGFQCPAIYEALRRNADGMQDPVTGEYTGISAAEDFEAVPAFIPRAEHEKLMSAR